MITIIVFHEKKQAGNHEVAGLKLLREECLIYDQRAWKP
jgi:hypothetical protein